MIRKFTECCAARIIHQNSDYEGKFSIIVYGLELLISSLIGLLLLAGISIILGKPFAWISFIAGFVPLRTTAGGYHAKTHTLCYITICLLFSVSLIIVDWLPLWTPFPICLISLLQIVLFSPVETLNKPLTKSRRLRNRHLSIGIISVESVLAVVLICASVREGFSAVFYMGVLSASILFVIEIIAQAKNRSVKSNNNKPQSILWLSIETLMLFVRIKK